ncbi:3,4-dihydroxy-2-butanone 4-phosphate synthase [Leclercia adecarboxylata]|uniref:3,4-dihydroxy-2-butanone 4-phosphate synthase n=1 Tax=Leclercia adecarboxylata TaxID=83655 RepID=A0A4U9IN62_9ENTR|nr:3,4-dihydroxy-2-butanone 4-phosphate synthase [Leclercia adecarboxylata]
MNQTLLSSFGTSAERVEHAIAALREGRGVMVLDDEDRENEGDMIFAAETMTVEQMALTIRHGSGIVCLCITEDRRKQLELPMMVEKQHQRLRNRFYRHHRSRQRRDHRRVCR